MQKKNQVGPKFIKEKFRMHMLFSTMHGVQNIIRTSNKSVKFIWFLCIILATSCCGYFMLVSLVNYLNRNIVTQMNNYYERVSQFPTLSICSTLQPLYNVSILKCEFNRDDCTNNFQYYFDQYYDKCFRFNSGVNVSNNSVDILTTTVGGYRYGLRIDLNITSNLDFNNLVVHIHNFTTKPNNLRNKGYHVTTGSINYFQIEKLINEKLDKPYSECLKNIYEFKQNKTIIKYLIETNNSYSQVECIRLCRNLMNMEKSGCNCVKAIDIPTECELTKNQTVKDCYENFFRDFQKKDVFETCSAYCPLECDSISYSIKLNSQQLPVKGKINSSFEYKQFNNYELVQKNFISIRAYYPTELKYSHIKQQPYIETVDLISQIGGTLGLFLGISFLSFIELIELFIEFLVILFKK